MDMFPSGNEVKCECDKHPDVPCFHLHDVRSTVYTPTQLINIASNKTPGCCQIIRQYIVKYGSLKDITLLLNAIALTPYIIAPVFVAEFYQLYNFLINL